MAEVFGLRLGGYVQIEVEASQIDRKYESHRLRSKSREAALLASIVQRGIDEPLQGVMKDGRPILLDGFKRLRCVLKIGAVAAVPFIIIAEDEAQGILQLIKSAANRGLAMIEQARLVDELKNNHGLSVVEIARCLERSSSWVVVRLNVLSETSAAVTEAVFSGRFPAYSLLYTLRQFRRLNGVSKAETDYFVKATAGKDLSVRDIDLLAGAYFRGGLQMKEQIIKGDLLWCLSELKERNNPVGQTQLSDMEKKVLRDLEMILGAIGRVTLRLNKEEFKEPSFFAQVTILVEGLLSRLGAFTELLRGFYGGLGKT